MQGDVPFRAQGRRAGRARDAGQGLRRAFADRAAVEVLHEQIAAGLVRRANQQQQRPRRKRHQKQVPTRRAPPPLPPLFPPTLIGSFNWVQWLDKDELGRGRHGDDDFDGRGDAPPPRQLRRGETELLRQGDVAVLPAVPHGAHQRLLPRVRGA